MVDSKTGFFLHINMYMYVLYVMHKARLTSLRFMLTQAQLLRAYKIIIVIASSLRHTEKTLSSVVSCQNMRERKDTTTTWRE